MKIHLLVFLLLIQVLTACSPSANPANNPDPQPVTPRPEQVEAQPTKPVSLTPTNTPPGEYDTSGLVWSKSFTGSEFGAFFDLIQLADGDYIVVGATNHLHVPPYSGDALLIQLSPEGEIVWEKTWGGDGYEQAWAVYPAEEDGYFIFGETNSVGAGDRDFFLLKTSPDGTEEWSRTYGGAFREWPFGMLRLSNGDLLMFGFTEIEDQTHQQYAVRAGTDGEILWEYVGQSSSAKEEIILDAIEIEGTEILLIVNTDEDAKLVSLDQEGTLQWEKRFEIPGWQYFSKAAPIEGGDLLLAGFWMTAGSPNQADTWLARCTTSGEIIWEKTFGDTNDNDYAQSLVGLSDGTFLIGGLGQGMPFVLVDENGHILWQQAPLGSGVFGAAALLETENGVLAAGLINLVNGRSYDAVLVEINLPVMDE